MVAHAQASHGSGRASLVGLASAGAGTPEKHMMYETDRFGLGNPQGFDRGGGERFSSAAPGSAMAPGGTKPAGGGDPGGGVRITSDYSSPAKKT